MYLPLAKNTKVKIAALGSLDQLRFNFTILNHSCTVDQDFTYIMTDFKLTHLFKLWGRLYIRGNPKTNWEQTYKKCKLCCNTKAVNLMKVNGVVRNWLPGTTVKGKKNPSLLMFMYLEFGNKTKELGLDYPFKF
ncbi:uncharacterized protein LOC130626068 [Hydractinia symbiolongicarpus]|uniref:uncharacterized protein LOC130626068 n=1 Tax=Hydractinia symbiolongicarpus TaxID=13093 RepID=UPI00254FE10B|nr:uncharacterized protein LOC130626068 [Hydractinia symbiolongicarpus]